ncbi:DUF3244 domain-containing protein [Larkinella soli]|uniref:DUF3244 domain-containing protein n=1 Tax=Larkinella soli TaxID=1770527 RepID=UPI000FFB5E8B|nr:T9SS C-terminal target domain-containing protein [Larkinella soli]
MKKTILLMLGLIAGTASFAQTSLALSSDQTPPPEVSITTDQKIRLLVEQQSAKGTVSLRDDAGHVLYTKNVNLEKGLVQTFNVSGLESGIYHLAVVVAGRTVDKSFSVGFKPAQMQVQIED